MGSGVLVANYQPVVISMADSFNNSFFRGRGKSAAARYAAKVGPTCVMCARPALRRVGSKGYCKVHMAAAGRHLKQARRDSLESAQRAGTAWVDADGNPEE